MKSNTKRALGLGAVGLLGLLVLVLLNLDRSGGAAGARGGDDWIQRKYSATVSYQDKSKQKSGAASSGPSTNAPKERP
jgi:hypothetical protein